MKLYSRGQVFFFSVLSALAVVLLALGFTFLGSKTGKKPDAAANAVANAVANAITVPKNTAETDNTAENTLQLLNYEGTIALNTAEVIPYSKEEQDNINIYEQLNSAVVNITTKIVAINWFLEPVPQEGGSGSGSIIDTRGYVLTNTHVIENAY
jgi:S1-C subfamily serine protease